MAKVSSHFSCMLCKQKLNFPPNTQIVDFMILILQFYKCHEICEQAEAAQPSDPLPNPDAGIVEELPSKKRKRRK